jgi:hypothetical protein
MAILVPRVFKLLTLVACATAAYSSAAQAVDNTRYISITGNDASDCTLAAPCRNLPRGKNSTPAGGELRILDSGDYGNSGTVNKSLTISGNGNTVFLRNPIIIDNANAVVTLRGLTLNGQGTIANGISIVAAAVVHIENCVVHNFSQDGIIGTADGVSMFVVNSVSRDNGGGGLVFNAGASLTIDNSHFDNNVANGVWALGQDALVTIRRSTASGNGFNGFQAFAGVMTLDSSLGAGNNLRGLNIVRPAIGRISNSTFTDNSTGINNSGTVETRQNNTVRGNQIDLQGNSLTSIGSI